MFKYWIFLVILMVSVNSSALQYSREKGCFLADGNSCSAAVSLLIAEEQVSAFSDNKEKPLAALREYYRAAQANNLAKIISLHSEADGSRSIIKESLTKNPLRYSRFFNIKDVVVSKSAKMGNYYSYLVKFIDASGKVDAVWSEMVHCPDKCYLSVRALHPVSETHLYGIATSLSRQALPFSSGSRISKLSFPAKSSSAVEVDVVVKNESSFSKSQADNYAVIQGFINSVKSEYASQQSLLNYSEVDELILSIANKYWQSVTNKSSFYMVDVGASSSSAQVGINKVSYFNLISKSKSERLIGLIQGSDIGFFIIEFSLPDIKKYGIFPVDKAGGIVLWDSLKPENSLVSELIHHKDFVTQLVGSTGANK